MAKTTQQGHRKQGQRACSMLIMLLLSGLLMNASCLANGPTPAQVAFAKAELAKFHTWINAPWTSYDQVYTNLRESIDQQATTGQKATALMQHYESILQKNPKSLPDNFAYYYAAYWSAVLPGGIGDGPNDMQAQQRLDNAYLVVMRQSPPHTYNFVRLIYLCTTFDYLDPTLKQVGIRLVQHQPGDYQVQFYTVELLEQSRSMKDQALALKYAQDLVQRYPKKPNVYSLLASTHYQMWQLTKDKKEAALALSGYQQYLHLAPPTFRFYRAAQKLVAQLQGALKSS